jgi:hypothetical protein
MRWSPQGWACVARFGDWVWGGGTRLPLVGATVLLLYRLKTSNTSGERVHFAKALKMGRSHSSFITKPCACASMEFLAEITSLAVDDTSTVRYRCTNLIRHLLIRFLIKFIINSTLKCAQLLSFGLLHGIPISHIVQGWSWYEWWMMKLKESWVYVGIVLAFAYRNWERIDTC